MDTCISKPWDVPRCPPVLSPRPCRWEVKGHGTVFHLRNVSVYIISLWEKGFSAILLPGFSLGELLVGHNLNCKTPWASFWWLGVSGGEECILSPWYLLPQSDQQCRVPCPLIHSFIFLRPLPPTGQSVGLWASFGDCDFCGTDFSYIWRAMLSNYGKCPHILWEKIWGDQQYIGHFHRWILREKHFGIGITDSNTFQRPFSHSDDFLKMKPDLKDLCPLPGGFSSQYVDSMWIWLYKCSRKTCSWSLFKSFGAGNDLICKATRNHRWWLNYPHFLKPLPISICLAVFIPSSPLCCSVIPPQPQRFRAAVCWTHEY